MKNIEQHLQDLPEPYRSQALKNMWWEDKGYKCELLSHALRQAFNWSVSPEKYRYWNQLHTVLVDCEKNNVPFIGFHTCKYCGVITQQPDKTCYKAP